MALNGVSGSSKLVIPRYEELTQRDGAPNCSAWGIFGDDDELGTVNFISTDSVVQATRLVEQGKVFNLDCPINAFHTWTGRRNAEHVIFQRREDSRDDYLDSFYLQSTSQIDGLRHIRHPEYGFYNGHQDASIVVGTTELGIQHWADSGIVGRGVLLDVARSYQRRGKPIDFKSNQTISVTDLERTAEEQGLKFRPGDILLIRTGWLDHYFNVLTEDERIAFASDIRSPGLIQSYETLSWLWNHQFSVIAADNMAVEAIPPIDNTPFEGRTLGLMHHDLIALLGFALGELWHLDDLADDCNADKRYEFLLTAKVLNLVGGVGSPPNAMAIK
jgi:hypothetical protein